MRRRRSCLKCNYRFTTYEKEEDLNFIVRKKDARFEAFSQEKAMRAIQIACQKRPIAITQMESLLSNILRQFQEEGERVIESARIGDFIMEGLRQLDHVAYVRFASVYKEFKDTEQFMTELRALGSKERSQTCLPES